MTNCIPIYHLIFILTGVFFGTILTGTNVKDYGAVGDGIADDTDAIRRTIRDSDDGIIIFPRGRYRITGTLDLLVDHAGPLGIRGEGGSATIIMEAPGPAIRISGKPSAFTAFPETIPPDLWVSERMPVVESIEIIGAHPESIGIEISYTMMTILRGILIRDVKYGVHFTNRNRNVIIEGCHIYNCSEIGVYMDEVNIHQMNITHSHISYNKESGIKIANSQIRNLQITGNDIEYNYDLNRKKSADIWMTTVKKGSIREGTITGNTIQSMPSPGGYNILMEGRKGDLNEIGLWSILGNHISNQTINVCITDVRGVTLTGNTFIRGYEKHIVVRHGRNIILSDNILDHNDDYFTEKRKIEGGILIQNSEAVTCANLILDGIMANEALMIEESKNVVLSGCQFSDLLSVGIKLLGVKHASIFGCQFSESNSNQIHRKPIAIFLNRQSNNLLITGNMVNLGSKGMLLNDHSDIETIKVEGNMDLSKK